MKANNHGMGNQPSLNELALFAGAGGGILGGHLLGWRTVCAVEWEPYAACVLVARQNDGVLPPFPIWDDVQTFDGKPWRGIVDVISGGFPCQDISAAGKGAGITGERSGLWKEFARIICEVRPRFVFVENSPMLTSRGLDTVLRDLAALGYDAEWGVLGAHHAGAPHKRDRMWIVAHAAGYPGEQRQAGAADGGDDVANSLRSERRENDDAGGRAEQGHDRQRETAGRTGKCGQDVAHADMRRRQERLQRYCVKENRVTAPLRNDSHRCCEIVADADHQVGWHGWTRLLGKNGRAKSQNGCSLPHANKERPQRRSGLEQENEIWKTAQGF